MKLLKLLVWIFFYPWLAVLIAIIGLSVSVFLGHRISAAAGNIAVITDASLSALVLTSWSAKMLLTKNELRKT